MKTHDTGRHALSAPAWGGEVRPATTPEPDDLPDDIVAGLTDALRGGDATAAPAALVVAVMARMPPRP